MSINALRIIYFVNRYVAESLASIAACLLVGWVFVMMVGLTGRAFFQVSWMFVEEYTAYVTLTVGCWGFQYALYKNTHIRLTMLVDKLPHVPRSALETLFTMIAMFLYAMMAWRALDWLMRAIRTGAASPQTDLPMWIPYLVPVVGFASLLIGFVFHLASTLLDTFGKSSVYGEKVKT